MNQKELSELSDQELLTESGKRKSNATINFFFIGFLIGILIYSIWVNSWGLFTLIPLFLVYKLIQNSKKDKDLEKLLKERNLK